MNEGDIKILAIVGMSGSGKSVVVDYYAWSNRDSLPILLVIYM